MSGRPHTSRQWTLALVALAIGGAGLARAAAAGQSNGANAQPPVVLLTSQQDHDRQMRLLKISGFPPGPDPYQVATYDEAAANPRRKPIVAGSPQRRGAVGQPRLNALGEDISDNPIRPR